MTQDIIAVQECRSTTGWVPVEIRSESHPGSWYVVLVNPWGLPQQNVCECKGYQYRGYCRHQLIASDSLCRWTQIEGPEEQTPEQRRAKICPRCGGGTRWTMEVVESDE